MKGCAAIGEMLARRNPVALAVNANAGDTSVIPALAKLMIRLNP